MTSLFYLVLTAAIVATSLVSASGVSSGYFGKYDLCSTNGICDQCVSDIRRFGGSLNHHITKIGSNVDATKNQLQISVGSINSSVTSVTEKVNNQKTTVSNKITSQNENIINLLMALRKAYASQQIDKEAIAKLVRTIHAMQSELHSSIQELITFSQELLTLVKHRGVLQKLANIEVTISEITKAVQEITKLVQLLQKIDKVIENLNKVTASLTSVSVSLSDIDRFINNIKTLQASVRQSLLLLENTVVKHFTNIENSVKNIDVQLTDILRRISVHTTNLLNLSNLIKTISSSINSISTLVANLKSSFSSLEENIKSIDKWIMQVLKVTEDHRKRIQELLVKSTTIINKSSQTRSTFESLKLKIEQHYREDLTAMNNLKNRLNQIIVEIDALFSLQKKNSEEITSLINYLKAQVNQMSATIAENSRKLTSISNKSATLRATMNKALMALKALTNKCIGKVAGGPCSYRCSADIAPVCASNKRTYTNKCEMTKHACRLNTVLTVVSSGICIYNVPLTTPTTTASTTSPCPTSCPQTFAPVCGSDGKTYSSSCHVTKHNCETGSTVIVVSVGSCATTTLSPCLRVCTTSLVKVCGTDGKTYNSKCHLEKQNCLTGASVALKHYGSCTKKCYYKCSTVYSPVCGTDGVTYGNLCLLKRRGCKTNNLNLFKHNGKCQETTTASSCDFACSSAVTPVCGSDGKSYDNQCLLLKKACIDSDTTLVVSYIGSCTTTAPPTTTPACSNVCTQDYRPVCGTDGQTYNNACLLRYQKCKYDSSLEIRHEGKCGGGQCESGWIQVTKVKGCYFIQLPQTALSFDEAMDKCRAKGATLAWFNNDHEYRSMQTHIRIEMGATSYQKNFWIGGKEENGVWLWLPSRKPVTLTKAWYPGRPKSTNVCLVMYGSVKYRMVDVQCKKEKQEDKYGFICRK